MTTQFDDVVKDAKRSAKEEIAEYLKRRNGSSTVIDKLIKAVSDIHQNKQLGAGGRKSRARKIFERGSAPTLAAFEDRAVLRGRCSARGSSELLFARIESKSSGLLSYGSRSRAGRSLSLSHGLRRSRHCSVNRIWQAWRQSVAS